MVCDVAAIVLELDVLLTYLKLTSYSKMNPTTARHAPVAATNVAA